MRPFHFDNFLSRGGMPDLELTNHYRETGINEDTRITG